MAEKIENSSDGESAVHIVYVDRPEAEEAEAFHIRTLASVVGSEDAAKEALIYHYKHAASGFSAKLTQKQVAELSGNSSGDESTVRRLRIPKPSATGLSALLSTARKLQKKDFNLPPQAHCQHLLGQAHRSRLLSSLKLKKQKPYLFVRCFVEGYSRCEEFAYFP